MNKLKYINARYNGEVETVDEFPFNTKPERVEFKRVLGQYQLAYQTWGAKVYSSQRACKEWTK